MTDPLAAPPRWRHHLKRASSAGRDVIVDATRRKRVEVNVVHVLTAALSLGVPIVLGLVLDDIGGDGRHHLPRRGSPAIPQGRQLHGLCPLVMTPFVAVPSGLGHQLSPSLLGEQLIDTTTGCLISLIIGYAAWRRARQAA